MIDLTSIRCLCPQGYYDRLLIVRPTNNAQFRMASRRRVTDGQTVSRKKATTLRFPVAWSSPVAVVIVKTGFMFIYNDRKI